MPVHFHLHRFGIDEFAVGRLINGDLPEDDEERWNIVSAPRYRVQQLLAEHQRAQAVLRDCRDSGRPFVLFLRSFSSEHHSDRVDGLVASNVTVSSHDFLRRLNRRLAGGFPVVRLHGGSDAVLPGAEEEANVLSTTAENWEDVAGELIDAASAIVLLLGEMSPGVARELELIRAQGGLGRTFVTLVDPRETPSAATDQEVLRAGVADVRRLDFPALVEVLHAARTRAPLERSIDAAFSYLEPEFVASDDFAAAARRIWVQMINLRVLFEDTYWAALKRHGVPFEHFDFPMAWVAAHQVYGLALATADFRAIAEALRYLELLSVSRRADFALVIPQLAKQFDDLGRQMSRDGSDDREARFAADRDPLKLPATKAVCFKLCELAADAGNPGEASFFYQAATVCALRSAGDADMPRDELVSGILVDWAQSQTRAGDVVWAVANYELALALQRELCSADPARYTVTMTFCLNNLGTLRFQQGDPQAAARCFEESLALRRVHPSATEPLRDLSTSLLNLGIARVQVGEYAAARSLYVEGLAVCGRRADGHAPVDLARQEAYLSLCLVHVAGAADEAREYARRAAERMAGLAPDAAAALRPLVDAALTATSDSTSRKE